MNDTLTLEPVARRRFRTRIAAIVVAAVAAAGLVTVGANPAFAAGSITNPNNDYTVPQGGQWTFEGDGFEPDETLVVRLDSASGTVLRTFDIDANGEVGTVAPDFARVPIASSVTTGSHTLYFSDGVNPSVSVGLTVVAPTAVTLSTSTSSSVGGTITINGSGWTTTHASGSAIVAFKIEPSGNNAVTYNHLTGYAANASISGNLTIWAYARPDANGNFSVTVTLPNGTTSGAAGSSPAFTNGTYVIRALSGSLQSGDRAAALLAGNTFTVS